MKEFFLKHKNEIFVGVIVYIITSFGDWFVNLAPDIGETIFGTVNNLVYSLAAMQTYNSILIIFIFVLLGCLLGNLIEPIHRQLSILKQVKLIEDSLRLLPDGTEEELNKIVNSNLDKKEQSAKEYNVKEILSEGKQVKKRTVFIVVYICLTIAFVNCCWVKPAMLWNKFEQDVTLIYPYVDNEKEIYQLKSDWVSMRSASDYNEIYVYIDEVKEINNLPK